MVLEARKDAEVAWYQIIWEDTKQSSNIIDYNINKEITIDQSSVPNWNNDTTTGMANVIPWINAPKLIPDTSLYKPIIVEKTPSVTITWNQSSTTSKRIFTNFVRTLTTDLDFWNYTDYLVIPVSWVYTLNFKGRDQWYPNTHVQNDYAYYYIDTFYDEEQIKVISWYACEFVKDFYFQDWTTIKFYVQNTSWASMSYYCEASLTKL